VHGEASERLSMGPEALDFSRSRPTVSCDCCASPLGALTGSIAGGRGVLQGVVQDDGAQPGSQPHR